MELGEVEGLCGFCRNKELDSEYVQYGIAKFDGDKLIIIPRFVRKIPFAPRDEELRAKSFLSWQKLRFHFWRVLHLAWKKIFDSLSIEYGIKRHFA